ncbi:LSU ribosomal protein L24p (L26e) [[Mycoplasma] cavipharyngis]|uniref:50S ribosomal protein L24 n=1 Tax=[Mycoplasma] cavipharyngis TaxID=92757 RepID=UPI00370497F3
MKRIIKGDMVRVISGEHKGKEGTVLSVFPKEGKVIIEGVNLVSVHTKPNQQNNESGIISKEAKLDWSKVTLVNKKSKLVYTKIGYVIENNKKQRVDRKTGLAILKNK